MTAKMKGTIVIRTCRLVRGPVAHKRTYPHQHNLKISTQVPLILNVVPVAVILWNLSLQRVVNFTFFTQTGLNDVMRDLRPPKIGQRF
jgi:DUF1365 family protein